METWTRSSISASVQVLRPLEAMETTSADKDLAVMKQRLVDGLPIGPSWEVHSPWRFLFGKSTNYSRIGNDPLRWIAG